MIGAVLSLLLLSKVALAVKADACSQFSSSETDSYWDAIGRCDSCTALSNCGFCVSTLKCIDGLESGPTDGSPCPAWSFGGSDCPVVPNCGDYVDCSSCASQEQCAWCASDNLCTTMSEAFSKDCRGLVFELPCPANFVADNVIVGNLIIRSDPTFGGGELNVQGRSLNSDGEEVEYSMKLNSSTFSVASAGNVQFSAGDTSSFRGSGGNITFSVGSGLNPQGGSGGSFKIRAGDGYGQQRFGGSGSGGNVEAKAGNAIQGSGGSIDMRCW